MNDEQRSKVYENNSLEGATNSTEPCRPAQFQKILKENWPTKDREVENQMPIAFHGSFHGNDELNDVNNSSFLQRLIENNQASRISRAFKQGKVTKTPAINYQNEKENLDFNCGGRRRDANRAMVFSYEQTRESQQDLTKHLCEYGGFNNTLSYVLTSQTHSKEVLEPPH